MKKVRAVKKAKSPVKGRLRKKAVPKKKKSDRYA